MYKKGVSEVVTAILLILLAIAAILNVWQFVKPTVENVGKEIETSCLDVDLEVTAVDDVANTVTIENSGTVDVDDVLIVIHDSTGGAPFKAGQGLTILQSDTI